MRPSGFRVSGAVRRGRGDYVGSATGASIHGRSGTRRDEDGGGGVGHVIDCGANLYKVVEWLSGGVVVISANAEDVLLKAFVEVVEDGIGGSQFEERWRGWELLGVAEGVFIQLVVQP